MNCTKCKSGAKTKNVMHRAKQRYKCKNFVCSYRSGHHPKIREKAIAYYLKKCEFLIIEGLPGMSYHSVMNWVRQGEKAVQKISEDYEQKEKIDVLKLDELCTFVKNEAKSGYGLQ